MALFPSELRRHLYNISLLTIYRRVFPRFRNAAKNDFKIEKMAARRKDIQACCLCEQGKNTTSDHYFWLKYQEVTKKLEKKVGECIEERL